MLGRRGRLGAPPCLRGEQDEGLLRRSQPPAGVFDDAEGFWLLVDRKRLVAGAEVEDAALADGPDAAAAEVFASVPLFLEDHLVGRRDVERLVVHLRLPYVPLLRQAGR